MKISAVIPVKKNSSRLPNKNILPFRNSTLLEEKILQLKKLLEEGYIHEIVVSSDSNEMLSIAERMGVHIDNRPIELANETRPFSDFLQYICKKIEGNTLMWACCTSPFVDVDLYKKCIDTYKQHINIDCDSLITVYKFQHFLLDDKGPFNFERGLSHKNSQDLPSFDLFTNGVILSPVESVKKWNYHFGPNVYRFYVGQKEAIDIDTPFDYEITRLLGK